ncbi:ParB/RepB/Spo0J family partition protein [Aliarcobacter butzleri]|uniref:ParB/RepB/Spo0J family partition protein n=1 Tax=Aliarcobacter butzleri TaxID=28197 RepID=UPI003AF6A0C9
MSSSTKKPNLAEITKATAGKTKTSGISPFSELEISKVYPNPDQPRKAFEDIEELAATIKEHGLLQPITVVKKDDEYMLVSGERRYKAHLFNEAKTIKAYILDTTDEKVEELTLIENIQRNDLTDFEIANHIVKLWKTGRYEKKSDLAKKVGKSESYVSKAFSSLNLDDEILEDITVNKKDISISVMDEISRVKDKKVQKEVYQKYNAGEITRDDIKEFKEPKNKIEAHNEKFIKDFSETLKDLVSKPNTPNENFPTGNLEATFKVDDLVQDKTEILEAKSFKENFPWEKSYSEQYFYIEDFEKQLTQAFKDGYRQPFKKIKMNNAYEQKIHDLLLEQDTKYIDDCVDSINECVKRNGYKKEESGKIYLNAPGYHVRLRNRYGEIIFDLLKENLELKKELHNLKENQTVQDNSILEDKKEIALLELFSEAVTINYTNYDIDMGIDYQKAKKIIDKSKQESIPFNVGKGIDERVYRLINTDVRTIKDDCIVLIHN